MWIFKDIHEKKKKNTIRNSIIIGAVLLIGIAGWVYYTGKKNVNRPPGNLFTVRPGDITSTYSADGTVRIREEYKLNFPIGWTLSGVYKKEWDRVVKDEIIAKLDDSYLKIARDKASIAVSTARANLDSKLASQWRPSDIRVSEKQLDAAREALAADVKAGELEIESARENLSGVLEDIANLKKVSQKDLESAAKNLESRQKDLDNARRTLETILITEKLNLRNAQEKAVTEVDILEPLSEKYLRDIDLILGVTEENRTANDSFEAYLWAREGNAKIGAESLFASANEGFRTWKAGWEGYKKRWDYGDMRARIGEFLDRENRILSSLEATRALLRSSIPAAAFPQSAIDAYIAGMESDINGLTLAMQRVTLAAQNIEAAQSGLDTKAEAQKNTIDSLVLQVESARTDLEKIPLTTKSSLDTLRQKQETYESELDKAKTRLENSKRLAEAQVRIMEANLDLKKSAIDPRELSPYYAAIENAKKWVEEAEKKLTDSVLRSPIDGAIGKLSADKIGTVIPALPQEPFVTVVNSGTRYVEARIEEGDISYVRPWQKVFITFNALDNVSLTGTVTRLADTSEIDTSGIVSYRVDIEFDTVVGEVKEGLTAQLRFVQETKTSIPVVPFAAVTSTGGQSVVTDANGAPRDVVTGINDGEYIEIREGLNIGDTISY